MKPVFAAILIAGIIIGCKAPEKKESVSIAGAYKMLSQSVKNDSTDTTYTSLHQVKIFTGDHMMYANVNAPDSISAFGVGTYDVSGDTVIETVIYRSADTSYEESPSTFHLLIEKEAKGYKQVIPDMQLDNGKITLTEDYETAGTTATTPLDGIWKLMNRYEIKGNDTTTLTGTQYKAYFAGQVLWGHTWKDSLNKSHTGIGIGKFEMNGTNKVKESMVASTYSDVRGRDFDIAIELNGTDGFTQSLEYGNGTRGVEVYQRLKK